jgi:hypothetical protein
VRRIEEWERKGREGKERRDQRRWIEKNRRGEEEKSIIYNK